MKEVREEMKKKKLAASDDVLRKVESGMDKNGVRRLNYLKEKGTGINVTCSDPQLYLWHCSLCSRIQR